MTFIVLTRPAGERQRSPPVVCCHSADEACIRWCPWGTSRHLLWCSDPGRTRSRLAPEDARRLGHLLEKKVAVRETLEGPERAPEEKADCGELLVLTAALHGCGQLSAVSLSPRLYEGDPESSPCWEESHLCLLHVGPYLIRGHFFSSH
ncbi:hypothetical protein NDU88_004070 [Pleurodeles waltl]|uniref:Uncharacterized protein n=1 Tax=Pleurodeles waltl TaxID=8319 RepID=A0AAV7MW70_PLEWA|nr:hypothetical protein NDU88_004070 [Pleurodeles waltl]